MRRDRPVKSMGKFLIRESNRKFPSEIIESNKNFGKIDFKAN